MSWEARMGARPEFEADALRTEASPFSAIANVWRLNFSSLPIADQSFEKVGIADTTLKLPLSQNRAHPELGLNIRQNGYLHGNKNTSIINSGRWIPTPKRAPLGSRDAVLLRVSQKRAIKHWT
jgi:hypothetical protein